MNRLLPNAAFFVGLAVLGWIAAGYLGHPLALAVTVLISAFFVIGAFELHRFQQATAGLRQSLAAVPEGLTELSPWLASVPMSLRDAVRLRIEGERVGLPGPAMAPYLTGLLVLLGMLGTFLGMVVTLNGTGLALDSATDVAAIRASLSAPVKGLGLAFGTSVAGVAASAMLGLMSALSRRERLQAAQLLDARIATTLRPFSLAYQREASFQLLKQQAALMPALVDRLQALMASLDQQSQALNEGLLTSQHSFHGETEARYAALAASVDRSLKDSLASSARAAAETIQPVVEATMAEIARGSAALRDTLAQTAQAQVDGLSARFEAANAAAAGHWQSALAEHSRTSEAVSQQLRAALDGFAANFEQRATALVDAVTDRQAAAQQALAATVADLSRDTGALHARWGEAAAARLDGVSSRLDTAVAQVAEHWRASLDQQARVSDQLSQDTQRALRAAADAFGQQAAQLVGTVERAHVDWQATWSERDEARLAGWTQSLQAMATTLQREWQQAGAQTLDQQQRICQTLEQTALDMSAQSQAHARDTIAEIERLVQAAAVAPRAAAEVVAELRQKLSDSMARDNAMLDERSRLLDTVGTLLETVNHASTEQRAAIDALVGSSAELLERVGGRFGEQVETESARMAAVAAQMTANAAEVASLGEAFGVSVQLFSESNEKLLAQLQRIESALGQSLSRSDEQLAYYVAQAREVIDLSILSQQQIVEDLQQLARRQAPAGSEA